ncbi:hypothetical protein GCM10007291_22380 [Gemmobacter nanjingensis]|uniref:Uncharacterized protein n=1 Tax=Gemmobacter nanjingensis TaxID=488454 RepID=A0ABQ3FGJ5_9RHOB|nr:hypothetical protein [Gemmobacter nanjingensis]GHC22448.1 hypothetical protein GCM10007291_22380 [Gemmobacter nanjingensis]
MSGKLSDLNDHLFAQLGRLSTELTPEQIEAEVARTNAIVAVAEQITEGANLQLKAAKLYHDAGAGILPMLPQIGKAVEK